MAFFGMLPPLVTAELYDMLLVVPVPVPVNDCVASGVCLIVTTMSADGVSRLPLSSTARLRMVAVPMVGGDQV